MINFKDFEKIDLRIGTIIEAEAVNGSEKLLRLIVDLGIEERQIIAGIGQSYDPEKLVGTQVAIVANMEPKTLMGLESQGMILATDSEQEGRVSLLMPSEPVADGAKLR
ncbi:MAG TPA: methionine--tRNA ligase subunit beta [Candidatus Vogelbacteria bacterium]|nr:methionine--tRNA ligase subunit beta [Candidatus Vogelbacteria bacterium]